MKGYNFDNIMFIDIETVPAFPLFDDMPDNFQKHWDKKSGYFRSDEESASDVYQRAGIYAEFGKIVCISVGLLTSTGKFRVKSFASDDEKQLLIDFSNMLNSWDKTGTKQLCGHNIKEFDVPYISRRMLVNGIKLPVSINLAGKKPWEVHHIDTLDLWKFGDYKNFTSLALLADLFDIPTPKDDIDGSQVYEVYYVDNDLERISIYCEKDVLCVANLLLRFEGKPIVGFDQIEKA